ncbi:MAG: hypothetical protein IKE85_05215 [Mogibacterium sp.]|nr:hypothetical protein [Mogibacterium sp.]
MPELKLVEGRLSEYYNHFEEYSFVSCQATATRLMGVIAMKITWRGKTRSRAHLYQVLHLDYSEYGIDEYLEFECIPGNDDYQDKKEEMNYHWNHFTSVMGGEVVTISPDAMLKLIELALPLAADGIDREYDDKENSDFRHYAVRRLEMMSGVLAEGGVTSRTCTTAAAIYASSPAKLASCETINYFIMRVIDHDYDAASYLSVMDRSEIEDCPLADPGIQTLVRSSITRLSPKDAPHPDGASFPYRCTITTLGRKGYYHSSFVIWLDGDYRSRNAKVSGIDVGSLIKLSEFESAIQVVQKEYITVFDCSDNILEGFNGNYIAPLQGVDPVIVPNGWLYTIYKKDNSHVNKTEYRLGDDVYGYALLTIGGQLIIMTHDMNSITTLDNAVIFSVYSPYLKVTGRYLLEKTPVFHTLCHSHGVYFEDLIDTSPED